jgi:sulfatase maturation enzyme AslB (radical SAM superfamily)
MKFPLRLSLDLLSSRVTRALAGDRDNATIFHLSPSAFSSTNQKEIEAESDPNAAVMEIPANIVSQTTAPIFWVGGDVAGDEPLLHPVIGRIASALNKTGRDVFLHTDGLRLRKRIHEFRPDPRLFLTVELAGRSEVHDQAVARAGCFVRVMEGIRAAKLSGFHVCAHFTVNSQSDACETGELFEYLDNYDVDGFIVSSGGGPVESATRNELQQKLQEIRALVRCSRWEYFSLLLEDSYAALGAGKAPAPAPRSDASACKESA